RNNAAFSFVDFGRIRGDRTGSVIILASSGYNWPRFSNQSLGPVESWHYQFDLENSKVSRRRVVVTGLGMVSSLGNTVADTWQGLVNGKSGVSPITTFDVSAFTTQFSASVKDLNVEEYFSPKE